MAKTVERLSLEELERRVRGAGDVVERNHCQAIWLLAKGHTRAEVAELMALSPRWIAALAERYERERAGGSAPRQPGRQAVAVG